MRHITALLAFVSLTACTSKPPPRESVVMAVSADEAHVRLGKNRVAVGDEVVFRRNNCEPDPTKGKSGEKCTMRIVGHGRVVRLDGDEYSVVHLYKGSFEEGDAVEPAR